MILFLRYSATVFCEKEPIKIKNSSFFWLFLKSLFLEILDISTEVTGALDGNFFSTMKILAFFATKDLFLFISYISTKGNSALIFNFFATFSVIIIL